MGVGKSSENKNKSAKHKTSSSSSSADNINETKEAEEQGRILENAQFDIEESKDFFSENLHLLPDLEKIIISYLAGYDLLVMPSAPTKDNLPEGSTTTYVLVQDKPEALPTALYFVDKSGEEPIIKQLNILAGHTIAELIAALYPRAQNHHYEDKLNLSHEQLQHITQITSDTPADVNREEKLKAVHYSKTAYALFQPDFVSQFLKLLTSGKKGEYAEAEEMLKSNPRLLLEKATVTDNAGNTFLRTGSEKKGITAFQYALWAQDTHMQKMLLTYLPREEAVKQCQEFVTARGVEYQRPAKATEEKAGVITKREMHFDFTRTRTVYQKDINKCRHSGWEIDYWCRELGGAQREWPFHMLEEMCFPKRAFVPMPAFKEDKLPRGAELSDGSSCFPLVANSGAGFDFAYLRDNCRDAVWLWVVRGLAVSGEARRRKEVAADLAALGLLWEVRTRETAKLIQDLHPAPEKSSRSSPS